MGLTAGARAWATEFEETSATPRETALPGKALRPEHGVDNSNEPTASEGEEGSSIAVRMARFGWPAVKRRPSPCRPAPAMEPIRVSVPPLPKQPGPCEPSAVKSCAPLAAQSAFASARSNYDDLTPRSGARAAQREYLARMEAQIQRAPSQGQPCSSWEARAVPRPASSRSAAPSSSFDGAAKATVCYSGPSANAPTSARCAGTAAGTAASTVAGTAAGTVAGTAALPATTRGRTCSSARAPAAGWSGDATHLSFWELCESDEHLPELRRRLARQVGNSSSGAGPGESTAAFGRVRGPVGNVGVHSHHPETQRTPLHVAASCGARGVVVALLQAGSNPHALCAHGRTALEEAIASRHGRIVRLLMWMHADAEAAPSVSALCFAPPEADNDIVSSAGRISPTSIAAGPTLRPADDRPLGVTLPPCGSGYWSALPAEPLGAQRTWASVEPSVIIKRRGLGHVGATSASRGRPHGREPESVLLIEDGAGVFGLPAVALPPACSIL
jgi:hypothetical protein